MNSTLSEQVGGTHYKNMQIQPMEFCLANMTTEELIGVLKFNNLRYLWRNKDSTREDWQKAKQYIDIITEELDKRISDGHDIAGYATLIVNELEVDGQQDEDDLLINFPTTKFAESNCAMGQITHLISEAREFIAEVDEVAVVELTTEDMEVILDEATDFVHSYHTLAKIAPEFVAESIERVVKKNMDRGYYND